MVFQKFKDLHAILPKHKRVLDTRSHRLPHYIYPKQQMQTIKVTHREPERLPDKLALFSVKVFRMIYDGVTRFDLKRMTEERWINRVIFLETIAGVPGMVGGMCKHLKSIRSFEQDKGFIHHLLEQADNQRFHLFFFLHMKNPGRLMRLIIILGQGIFMNAFFVGYLISQRFCHRFVGYLQQEAVKTYTAMLSQIERQQSHIHKWATEKAPQKAVQYYHLDQKATMKDVILSIRADESTHRQTNHFIADVDNTDFQLKQQDIARDDYQHHKNKKNQK